MTSLQQAILQIHRLNALELSYIRTLAASRMIDLLPSDRSQFLNLPRELRDRIYYFAAVEFYRGTYQKTRYKRCDRTSLALSMVSKQIGSEFTNTLYSPEIIQGQYLDTSLEPSVWKPMSTALTRSTLHRQRILRDRCLFLGGFEYSRGEAMDLADCPTKTVLVYNLSGPPWRIHKPVFNGYLELVPSRSDDMLAGNCVVVTVFKEDILDCHERAE